MNVRLLLPTLFFMLCIGTSLFAADAESAIQFISRNASFKSVKEMAKKQNKPIFIDFTADWCGHCRKMDKRVFSQYTVSKFMNETFINYKVDVEKGNGPLISMMYNVRVLPTVVFLTPEGKVMLQETHLFTDTKFMAAARRVGSPYIPKLKPIHMPLEEIAPCRNSTYQGKQSSHFPVDIPELAADEIRGLAILE